MRVAILHNAVAADAPPDERDVLDQVAAIEKALRAQRHEVVTLAADLDLATLRNRLDSDRPDCVFNLVESLGGGDRGVLIAPVLLEILGLPFTGAPLQAVLMTTNKLVAKRLLREAGLPTPPWVEPGCRTETRSSAASPTGRVIVKSMWDHGSCTLDEDDVVEIDPDTDLQGRLENAGGSGDRFAEQYVHGREFNLALLAGPGDRIQVLPPAEMQFRDWDAGRPRVVGYRAKWVPDSFEYANTVRQFDFAVGDAPLLQQLEHLALACWRCFGLRGYARVDFRVDEQGNPWILEANANPCLAPDAGFAAALERADIPFATAVQRILDDAWHRAHASPQVAARPAPHSS